MTALAHDRASAGSTPQWHALDVATAAELLDTSPTGLSRDEAAERLSRVGPNQLPAEPPPPAIVLLLHQFASPLILILVVAAGVTFAMQEWIDTGLIVVALVLNAVIGFTQERRANGAVRALMRLVVPHARVVRDGKEWDIDSTDLVPGDVVLLESGSRVPADLRLFATNGLMIDESLITGESLPVGKDHAKVSERIKVTGRHSMAFTGSIVTSGRGRGYVVATAQNTELGAIAGLIRTEQPGELPLHQRLRRFARLVGVSVLLASVVTFISGTMLGESPDHMFHVAVAMAVSAVPEGLPVAVTITLAIGVTRMARRNAVLRRLPALETLGSTTVICSDKTGTLTENRMTVESVWTDERYQDVDAGLPSFEVDGVVTEHGPNACLGLTLATGVLTNEAVLVNTPEGTAATGDPTEIALLVAASSAGLDPGELRDRYPVLVEIPFEPEHQYSATVRRVGPGQVVFVKGAPERIIGMSTTMLTEHGRVPIDADRAHHAARELATQGLRVLAMAYLPLPADGAWPEAHDPEDLVLLGFQGMMDPPRAGVREAVASCHDAGVGVVMITGDHAVTARAIARRLRIADDDQAHVATGSDLDGLDDEQLQRLTRDVSVFARVSPTDKLRIVRALEADGHVVAVTGDGVNDAPALRAAPIGVSMGRGGTDVAREASDMVLSDDNFVSIVSAIEEGRVAFANIRKVSFFLVSTAVAETAAIMATVWLGWPLLLVPAQILWLNLVTNGVQDLALAFEPGSPAVLQRPPRPRREGIFSRVIWHRTAIVGVVMAAGALMMFEWQRRQGGSLEEARAVALTTLVVFNVFQVGNARAETRSLFTLSPWSNPFLFWATIVAITLHASALYFPPTQYLLGVEPISLDAWIRAIIVGFSIIVVVELHKQFVSWRSR